MNEKNIFERLQAARLLLAEMEIRKGGKNQFAGYKYFELSDFLPTVQQLLNDQRICPVVTFTKEYATLTLYDMDNPATSIIFSSPMAEANLKGAHPIQNMGAVETYQRRYLYMAAMEITEPDAVDASKPENGTAYHDEPKQIPAPKELTPAQFEKAVKRLEAGEYGILPELKKYLLTCDQAAILDKFNQKSKEEKNYAGIS